jgi:hypothetical protein
MFSIISVASDRTSDVSVTYSPKYPDAADVLKRSILDVPEKMLQG